MSNRSIGFVARLAVALTATGAMTVSVEAQRHFGGGGLRGGGLQGRANFHAPGSGGGGSSQGHQKTSFWSWPAKLLFFI